MCGTDIGVCGPDVVGGTGTDDATARVSTVLCSVWYWHRRHNSTCQYGAMVCCTDRGVATARVSKRGWYSYAHAIPRKKKANAAPALSKVLCPVSSYALAMRCPVLTLCIILRACYALPGTDLAYRPMRLLCDVRY
eukprot:3625815-Rhodomonas_salina.2